LDVMGLVHDQLEPKTNNRKKRQSGPNIAYCILQGVIIGSDPLDTNCIDRPLTCDRSFPYRSISGWCNHDDTANRGQGSTMNPFRRFMGAAKYDDGFNSVRRLSANGGQLPSTREISNKIFAEASIPSFDPVYNHMFMQYGQWVAHDVVFTPGAVGTNGVSLDCSQCESANITSNCAPIEVPDDDTYFPTRTANGRKACVRLTRAINGQTGLGPRAKINQNSHFLDLSQVYGNTDCVAKELRTFRDGQMIMFTNQGYTLPPKAGNDSNCQSQKTNPQFLCFTAGDIRNSLQPGLIPLHTIYLKQHNKWASQIRQLRPTWSDNLVYHEARRLLVAMYQLHIYEDYLPKVIGKQLMAQFDLNPGQLRNLYDPRVDPSISAEFGTAAFRFGHSQARRDLPRSNNNNVSVGAFVDLGAHTFYTDPLYDRSATVFHMAQGMVNSPALSVDRQFSFPMRNQIFEIRGRKASGVDLPAVNVQRAREMGVQGYNEVRTKIRGLSRANSFDDLSRDMDAANIQLLKNTYASVDDIDLYVGLLMERRTDPTALLGPTGGTIIADQFASWKKGDRFFFESNSNAGGLTRAEYNAIRAFTFSQLICENTDGMVMVQQDIFEHNARKVRCSSFRPFPMASILF
ncbi:hypothetical protein PFISCL1PPCAC_6868, partial [Pristionchus fissidentatus]